MDDEGRPFYWVTGGKPDKWTVVKVGRRPGEGAAFDVGTSKLLAQWLEGRVELFHVADVTHGTEPENSPDPTTGLTRPVHRGHDPRLRRRDDQADDLTGPRTRRPVTRPRGSPSLPREANWPVDRAHWTRHEPLHHRAMRVTRPAPTTYETLPVDAPKAVSPLPHFLLSALADGETITSNCCIFKSSDSGTSSPRSRRRRSMASATVSSGPTSLSTS